MNVTRMPEEVFWSKGESSYFLDAGYQARFCSSSITKLRLRVPSAATSQGQHGIEASERE